MAGMNVGMDTGMDTDFPHLDETVVATARYLEALTELSDDDVRAPSLLPGWTRGHVITHVARNADALAWRPSMRHEWTAALDVLDEQERAFADGRDARYVNEIGQSLGKPAYLIDGAVVSP